MSEALEQTQDMETAERPFLVREFVATDLEVKGRTVDVRLVPFGEVATVADPPAWEPYQEEWLPGVFDHQVGAAHRVHARYGHSPHVIDVVGHGLELRSVAGDGYHISTKIHATPKGDTTLELLRDGALPAVSLEAKPVRNTRTGAGVVQRVKAHLAGFAFCPRGAFAGAQVLAIRAHAAEQEVTLDEDMIPVDINPELVERCRRLGIALPQRYQAHPETDTSADADTSGESAPASTDNTESEEQR